jgi:hypothetical protein
MEYGCQNNSFNNFNGKATHNGYLNGNIYSIKDSNGILLIAKELNKLCYMSDLAISNLH